MPLASRPRGSVREGKRGGGATGERSVGGRCHGLEEPASPEGLVVSFIYLFSFIAFLTF